MCQKGNSSGARHGAEYPLVICISHHHIRHFYRVKPHI
jgi:hypothetical protein